MNKPNQGLRIKKKRPGPSNLPFPNSYKAADGKYYSRQNEGGSGRPLDPPQGPFLNLRDKVDAKRGKATPGSGLAEKIKAVKARKSR